MKMGVLLLLASAGCWIAPAPPGASGADASTERTWHVVDTQGPGKRYAPRLAYDAAHHRTVLYGGRGEAGGLSDTWVYDGMTWTQLCTSCPPGDRFLPAFGYDPVSRRVLLFGGSRTILPAITLVNDAWALDGDTWTPLAVTGLPAQIGGAFVFAQGALGIVGGDRDPASDLDRAEVYTSQTGTTWMPVDLPEPTPSTIAGTGVVAVYDEAAQRMIAIEDASGSIENDGAHDIVHSLDTQGWHTLCDGTCGLDRTGASLLRVPGEGTYLVAGFRPQVEISGTWILDETNEPRWRLHQSSPGGRDGFGITYDSDRGRGVIYGGNGNVCGGDCAETLEFY